MAIQHTSRILVGESTLMRNGISSTFSHSTSTYFRPSENINLVDEIELSAFSIHIPLVSPIAPDHLVVGGKP
jgi:hypothetical protein